MTQASALVDAELTALFRREVLTSERGLPINALKFAPRSADIPISGRERAPGRRALDVQSLDSGERSGCEDWR
jgi:hypothetical protein